jgi:DNA-binding CsgD family transcriptional regulator/tetratricopeptide (TPR) repeat protein
VISQLTECANAVSQTPRAVVVTGDEGIGKSRLLSVFAEQVKADGAMVLSGSCIDVGDLWPYHPLRDALVRVASEGAGTVDQAVVGLREILDADVQGNSSERLLARLHRGLSELAAGRLLLFVLDDMQWADSSTRRLMLTLLSGLTTARLLILAAVRTEDQSSDPALRRLLRELQRSRSAEVLELAPLDRNDTLELAERLNERPLSAQTAELIWQRSSGNPLFVEELLRGGGVAELPQSLRELVSSRVDALPAPAQEVVRVLCVAVRPVPHDLLVRVMRRPESDVLPAARAAVSARLLVVGEDGYTLRNRLVQEAVEADLLPAERISLHRLFAEALSERGTDSGHYELAHHWRGAGDPERAFPAVVHAAEEAERVHAFGAASRYWEIAMELSSELPGAEHIERLVLRAAETAYLAGDQVAALRFIDQLTHIVPSGSQPTVVISAERLGPLRARYLAAAGRLTEAQAEYERALSLPGLSPAVRAGIAARLAEMLIRSGQYNAARERAELAITLAAPASEATTSAEVMANAALGFSQAYLGDPAGGREALARAVQVAVASGDAEIIGTAYLHLAELLTGPLNHLEEGVQVAQHGAAAAGAAGGGRTHGTELLAAVANGLFRLGRWTDAVDACSEALEGVLTGTAAVDLLLARARVVMGMGDLDAAERDLRSAETLLADDGGAGRQLVPLATLRAGLAIWRRDATAAREAIYRGLSAAGEDNDDVWLRAPLVWHGLRAEADCVAEGRAAETELVQLLAAAAADLTAQAQGAALPVKCSVDGYALLGRGELSRIASRPDPEVWRRAAELWETHLHPYPAAYAQFREAEALFSQRARNLAAAERLREAHRTATILSAGPLRKEIEALASRARVTMDHPPTATATVRELRHGNDPIASLTAREREVLSEVSTGWTNRQIGQRLFISERTVEVHVSHILAKLHLSTRTSAGTLYIRSRDV